VYLSELPELVRSPTNDGSGGMNIRKVTVLSKADWEGIQYRLNKRQIEAEKIRKAQEEKERLHELSLERAKNWTNTIYVSYVTTCQKLLDFYATSDKEKLCSHLVTGHECGFTVDIQ